ncbi:tyrosine-type recombinase/integrase [Aquamicrobium zhengzhouense]|uniref:Tyrosine-type recombinase/integrase n=1 Tax=Aquamicrobium zhengzhouense TaxID=2781738 RepID=A0ABS0SDU2_9HYPH|nr:tyrosine-type recombinase/integrase [Aquamicrobium zhengzhouense]MBI1621470.1 tyrosine-type recombinase/integrase [Aquamicrobium zhengzhouense]
MPKKLPKGVSIDRDRHGNVRLYFRMAGKPKVRLREAPGTKEFDQEVACARLGIPHVVKSEPAEPLRDTASEGSFQWLVQQYHTRALVKLAHAVMGRRKRILDEVCESKHKGKRRGALPYALLERKHVLEIRDELRATPGAQNDIVKTISAMYGWAVESDLAKINPALGIKRLRSGDGFHTWSREEVAQFEDHHPAGSKARLALHLAMFTGLRLSDLAIVGRQHIRNGWLTIRPGKTKKSSGVLVELPVIAPLQATIDQCKTGDLTFLVTEFNKPFSVNGLGNKMRQWCDEAGLPQCSTHGLRKAGATIAAENGATDEELMAIFGWTTKQQTTHYTKNASRKRIAAGAAHKLIPEQKMDETVPPKNAMVKSGTKTVN